jgi:Outer membrane protein beta-barrel domain
MLKNFLMIGAFASVLSLTAMGRAQALPTATAKGSFQVGAGYTYADPDYGQKSIQGVSAFANFDIGLHAGLEADMHYVALITPLDLAENTYLIGPRLILPYGRFKLYGKFLAGIGDLVIQEQQDNIGHPSGLYFAYAGGGGLEYRATDRINVRIIDVEAQKWPNYGNGLSPLVITVGAAYHFR